MTFTAAHSLTGVTPRMEKVRLLGQSKLPSRRSRADRLEACFWAAGYQAEKPRNPALAFAAVFRAATSKVRATLEDRRKQADWARRNGGTGEATFPGPPPAAELDRLAYDVYLYSEDAGLFFASAVRSGAAPEDAPTYDEALAFLERHEEGLGRLSWPRGGWAELDGRWYKAGAARVAKDLGRDGLRRLGERLGPYRGAGRTALLRRVNAWLRAAP